MIDENIIKEGNWNKLTTNSHPNDGDIVELLGAGIAYPVKTIKAKWAISGNGEHSYKWLSNDHEKGIPTISPEYWR